ncbi:MAG TPA: O-antigen ligase family protein, partial [Polyangiaceae bacterium]
MGRTLFAIAIPCSALALGSLHTWVLCAVTTLLTAGAATLWFRGSPSNPRLPATILLLTCLGLTAFTALQAVPLPAALVHTLSPATADVWAGALGPLHEGGPGTIALSLDPTATRVQVLRGVAYLATFLLTLRIAERRGGTRFVIAVIVLTSVVLGISAVLHPLFGAQRVFGLYKPIHEPLERHLAPLLNANHLAGYINIGFCLALGASLDRRTERFRPITISLSLLLMAIQLWVGSRGGTVAMAFAMVTIFALARVARRFSPGSPVALLFPALAIIGGVAMMVLGASSDALQDLNSLDTSKVRVALAGFPLALNHPFFGIGRGTYEVAFPS